MKILITGGAGFIGSNLAAFFLASGHEVTVIDNLLTGSQKNIEHCLKNKDFQFIEADICSYRLSQLPDFNRIYHLASPASPVQYQRHPLATLLANSQGTHHVLELASRQPDNPVIIASTSETYGDPLIHPQTETYWGNVNPIGPRSCYDEAKRFSEAISMAYFRNKKLNVRIARIFNTYGPNMEKDDGRVVSNFIVQALSKKPLTIQGSGLQTRSFCFVDDLVRGLFALGNTPRIAGEVINLGNPDERTIQSLAQTILKLTKSPSAITKLPEAADDPKMRKPDIAKAKKLLSWEPKVDLETGLQKSIAYFSKRFFPQLASA